MNSKHAIPLAAALGLLALPTSALAAPAKIGSSATVSPSGVASVKVANPNRYALKGAVRLITGQQLLASKKVKIRGRRSTTATMRLSKGALAALRAGGSRATVSAKLGHGRHKGSWIRRSVRITTGGAGGGTGNGGSGGGTGGNAGGGVTSNRWLATTSTGATFPFTLDGSAINITSTPLMLVSCFQTGGSYQSSTSSEMFDLAGPWTLGNQDGTQTKSVPRVNQLVGSGARTVTYKLKSSRAGNAITGSLTQSFSDSKYNPFDNSITFINCAGTLNFTAAPAG
jgi:hypothetical protein